MLITEHFFEVPLDYASWEMGQGGQMGANLDRKEGTTKSFAPQKITVFARKIISSKLKSNEKEVPALLYLQGGPGFESPRPYAVAGWLKVALETYQVILLDQRGTGLSSPVNAQTLSVFESGQEKADFVKFFRADSIVRDAEEIRKTLFGPEAKWSLIGQSFGGFCIITYLSFFPQSLDAVFTCGGLAPLVNNPDDVYTRLCARVIQQNEKYYKKYPDDEALALKILHHLATNEVKLPNGGTLTPKRFQQLGISAMGTGTGFERLHYLIQDAFEVCFHFPSLTSPKKRKLEDPGMYEKLSYKFLLGVQAMQPFDSNPLYAIIHEAIYCQHQPSNWSAERIFSKFSEFDAVKSLQENRRVYFFGEFMYAEMFDDYAYLRPLKEVAQILATYSDWPTLYDEAALEKNQVPVHAIGYFDDIYVDFNLAEQTTRKIGNVFPWFTNEYPHSGLYDDGARIFAKLLAMHTGD